MFLKASQNVKSVYYEFCKIFKNSFFKKTPPVAASTLCKLKTGTQQTYPCSQSQHFFGKSDFFDKYSLMSSSENIAWK